MDAQRRIARNVRRLRVAKAMSQEALATDSGIGRAYVSSLERGQKNPTVRLLERVSVALDADISELFVKPKPGDPVPKVLGKGRPRKR